MTEPIFADKDKSLKDYLISDYNRDNYKKMYSILQDGLARLERELRSASVKSEQNEIEILVQNFKNGLYLLEKSMVYITAQRKN